VPSIPPFDPRTHENLAPHLFILGAGASRAALPDGDPNGRLVPVMKELIPTLGLNEVLSRAGVPTAPTDFEALYDDLASSGFNPHLLGELEDAVRDYFASLTLPPSPTIYDYLLCYLRPKDVIATFNWDPLLPLAYERNMHLDGLPHTLFLHGNVAIGICYRCRVKTKAGGLCPSCHQPVQHSRLLFPVRNKDYTSDQFIQSEWDTLRDTIRSAYLVTIFGYSAPSTDIAARDAMLSVWQQNPYKELAQFEIVDIRPRDELHREWSQFITREHYGVFNDFMDTYLFRYPRRSCDAFSSASLMLEPWPLNHPPRFNALTQLHEWLQPLLEEEGALRSQGHPLSTGPPQTQ